MPTKDEMQELVENCTCEWTQVKGVNGVKFTGSNGKCIFIPAAGYRNGTSLSYAREYGLYWSSTPDMSNHHISQYLYFNSNSQYADYGSRYHGRSIRPVSD